MKNVTDTAAEASDLDDDFLSSFQDLVGAVFRLNGQLLNTAEPPASDLDISTGRWQTIGVLRNSPMTVSQISRRLGVTRQSSRIVVQRLEDAYLVELVTNPDHARSLLVQLTTAGIEMMKPLYKGQPCLRIPLPTG